MLEMHQRLSDFIFFVAQICNLLYRRIAFGRALVVPNVSGPQRLADCKSAIQQNAILRYVCTSLHLISQNVRPFHFSDGAFDVVVANGDGVGS
jgi:hypothetical protein